ncbi:MAG: biotin/lipoyl-containing protein [Bacteriovoracaceae bacterium]
MARTEVVMPQMGESITTGTITKWNKQPGEKIEIDEILLEISTDKVESEIPSPMEGVVVELLFEEGETVDVGEPIAYIDDDPNAKAGAGSKKEKDESEKASEESVEKEPKKEEPKKEETVKASDKKPEKKDGSRRFYTPLVRKLAEENEVDLSELEDIKGSGAGGRVNRDDFMSFLEQRKSGKGPQKRFRSKRSGAFGSSLWQGRAGGNCSHGQYEKNHCPQYAGEQANQPSRQFN